ncbi:hypothetical protein ERO13_D11G219450v2 [Gossypium hirsutum]|uniref:Uncharacterized protein n=2 Tax=Gossypium TaxID=3633 RepID=A0A5J5PHH1_GOSBA|nr:hypothetical protein ES319_D11G233500v1 [Gossypium barbadense]KAG4121626.1 hypothetical protein ERO13_D11G219450v2 [Gossypium hirsutum]TYH45160.1 hypothetical protein ES332_D11G245500v1 [Gossypium tomentosum]
MGKKENGVALITQSAKHKPGKKQVFHRSQGTVQTWFDRKEFSTIDRRLWRLKGKSKSTNGLLGLLVVFLIDLCSSLGWSDDGGDRMQFSMI